MYGPYDATPHSAHQAHTQWQPRRRQSIDWGDAIGSALRGTAGLSTLLVGAVMIVIPFVGQLALMGWASEIAQRVWWGHPQTVPRLRFADFGYWLKRGVTPFVTNVVAGSAIGMAMNVVMVPAVFIMLAVLAGTGSEEAMVLAMVAIMVPVAILAGLVVAPLFGAFMTFAEMTEDFGETFKLGRVFAFARATWGLHILSAVVLGIVGMIAALGGLLFFIVGVFLVAPVLMAAQAHVRAQIVQIYAARGGAPFAVRPPAPVPAEMEQMPGGYAR